MEEILENAVVTLEQISPSDKRYRIHIDTLHLHAKGDIESDMWFLDSKPVRLLGQMRFDEDVGHFFGDPRTKITFAILHSVLDLDPAFNIVFQRNDAFLGLLITDYAQFDGPHDKLHSLNGTTCQVTCMKASGDHAEHTFVHRPPPPQVIIEEAIVSMWVDSKQYHLDISTSDMESYCVGPWTGNPAVDTAMRFKGELRCKDKLDFYGASVSIFGRSFPKNLKPIYKFKWMKDNKMVAVMSAEVDTSYDLTLINNLQSLGSLAMTVYREN